MDDKDWQIQFEGDTLERLQELSDKMSEVVDFVNDWSRQFQVDTLYLAQKDKETREMLDKFIEKKYPKDISSLHKLLNPYSDKKSNEEPKGTNRYINYK